MKNVGAPGRSQGFLGAPAIFFVFGGGGAFAWREALAEDTTVVELELHQSEQSWLGRVGEVWCCERKRAYEVKVRSVDALIHQRS